MISDNCKTLLQIYCVCKCWLWAMVHRFNVSLQNLYSRKLNSDHIDWQFPTSGAEVVADPEMLLTECYSSRSPSTFWHFTAYLFKNDTQSFEILFFTDRLAKTGGTSKTWQILVNVGFSANDQTYNIWFLQQICYLLWNFSAHSFSA